MNCIFICIFHQEKYVNMFYLLLESLHISGNTNDILIYTSTLFMNMIRQSHLYSENIHFEINDTYDTIDKACKARLDLFDLSIVKYKKILYLDTDILIKGNIHTIFDVIKDDIIYTLEEGTIDNSLDYWGKTLFGDEIHNYKDITAFTSGILLFNHCEKIKELFRIIKEDIHKRPHNFKCYDQPYIVYNAFKYNLYNNKILKSFGVNNDNNIHSDKVIHHFPGGPGVYQRKIEYMNNFLNDMKDDIILYNIYRTKLYINEHLLPIINRCGELLEGNIFMLHHTTTYTNVFLNKIKNICNIILNKNIKNAMEIGFNSGFSVLLMLLSNPTIKITCFDLGEHSYTMPCYLKIKETFGDRLHLIIGDSTQTLRDVHATYDVIHIDGEHSTDVARSDIIHSYRLSKQGTILIMDDYDFDNLHTLWNHYITLYSLKKLDITTYDSPHHDIKYVVNDNEEQWILTLEKVIYYMDKEKKCPNQHDNQPDIKKLGVWVCSQKHKYTYNKMSPPEIRKEWEETLVKYKKYLNQSVVDISNSEEKHGHSLCANASLKETS